jgi:hypothetical protein
MATNHLAVSLYTLTLTSTGSRRGILAALGGLLAGPVGPGEEGTDARRAGKAGKAGKDRRKRKRRAPRAKRQQNPPPLSGPITRVDATCPINTGGFVIRTGDQRIAQTFTALRTGPLVQATIEILKGFGSTGDYILRLSAVDAAGVPTNDVLAVSVVDDSRVPDIFSALTFGFADPATVIAGTEYALVLTRPGSDQLEAIGSFGNLCAGRAFSSPSQTAPFVADPDGFIATFATFVTS